MTQATPSRPVLFSGPMIRALLDGRKTQTRRVIKPSLGRQSVWLTVERISQSPKLTLCHTNPDQLFGAQMVHPLGGPLGFVRCPYGQPGDLLWVRETWRPHIAHSHGMDGCDCEDVNVAYPADGELRYHFDDRQNFFIPDDWEMPKAAATGDVPSIHMPRWASRLTLEITGVRVERLQDISEPDAVDEGMEQFGIGWRAWEGCPSVLHARHAYQDCWKAINGPGAWDANPWVWVLEFRVHRRNVDVLSKYRAT